MFAFNTTHSRSTHASTHTSAPTDRRRFGRRLRAAAATGIIGAAAFSGPALAFDLPPINPNPPTVTVPLCERSDAPSFCFADYVAFASSFGSWPSAYEGVPARSFYVTVRNDGAIDPGALWTTVSIDQGEIIAIEPAWGDRNVVTAPVAGFDSEAVWTIQHVDGLEEDDFTTFRVWVDTYDAIDLAVRTNWHAGVEQFGETGLDGYRHRESNTANNVAYAYG